MTELRADAKRYSETVWCGRSVQAGLHRKRRHLVPYKLDFGVAAMLGYNTVRWNGAPVHGVSGLALGLFIGLLSIAFGTLLFVSGAKIVSMFSERLPSIPIKAAPESDQ